MTKTEQVLWLATLLATLAQSQFYGEVTVQIQKGDITIGRVNQTVKPVVKPFKEMTAVEYKMHRDLEKILGGQNG